jgi:serine/threonine protein phosphatase 1
MPGRTIAIGDIHGCSRALNALLETIQPASDDLLIVLGDFVDRGPDTKGVIRRLIALKDQCRLVLLMGNHEQMLLEARSASAAGYDDFRVTSWLAYGGRETLESYAIKTPAAIPDEAIDFIESCQDWHETEKHLFVHAAYYPTLPMEQQPPSMLRWESLRDGVPEPHESGKTCVVGHTAQKDGQILDAGHLICIDTYCYGGKWLSAMEVETGKLWQFNPAGKLREDGEQRRKQMDG